MSSHKKNDPILVTASNLSRTKGRIDLVKSDFDVMIEQKGYDVYIDRAVKCPCRNVKDAQALSSCKNCGGSGWVFFNREQTRMVVQGMGANTKYQEWSEIEAGTAKVTAFQETRLAFMDRITITNGQSTHNQLAFCIALDGKIRGKLTYDPVEITEIFLYEGTGVKLKFLVHNTDYTVNGNIVILADSYTAGFDSEKPYTLSIRYSHNPTYHVIDIPRDTMSSFKNDGGVEINQLMPVHAIVRKTHYVMDETNYGIAWLLNNDYAQLCSTYKAASDIAVILRRVINTDLADQTLEQLLASGAYLTVVSDALPLYIVDQVDDETSDTIVYVGKIKNDASDKWLIERITTTQGDDEEILVIEYVQGTDLAVYATDWDNRVALNYVAFETLTNL